MKTVFRLNDLRKKMKESSLDGVLIFSRNNCNYISGFSGSNGYVFVTLNELYLVTDYRYIDQARKQIEDCNIIPITKDFSCFIKILSEIRDKNHSNSMINIGFESDHISFTKFSDLKYCVGDKVSLKPIKDLIESIRAIKDLDEINILSKSVELADNVMAEVMNNLQPGMTELEISNTIDLCILHLNGEGVSFPSIVATGLNSAFPHHKPTEEIIKNGDSLIIDMGVLYRGYRSDISRTVFVGENKDSKFSEIYSVVLGAQQAAYEMATPGIKGGYLDNIAREFIKSKGYGDYFTHGLGHGVGLDIHEKPMIISSSKDSIDIGAVFTIEPGIYIPNWGGVRIEDIYVMEENGSKVLTQSPK